MRESRMPHTTRHRAQRGQSLVIFALIAVVLFAVIGLAVDGGFSYFASDKLERGAMAAALAGVPDMPDLATAPNDATTDATLAANANGWTAGGANNVAITVAQVPNGQGGYYNNRVQVTIASDVPAFFLKLMGFGTHRESRTAVAEYLRPITFGQPGNTLGATQSNLGTAGNFYFMRSEGWGTDRGQGDSFGPNPADPGNTGEASAPTIDLHGLSATGGTETTKGQPLAGMPARGGYNYQIFIPNGQSGIAEVYNPVFAPDNGYRGTNPTYNYHEDDSDFPETGAGCTGDGSTPPVSGAACDGPADIRQWPVMSYTLYKAPNTFDHTGDVWLSNMTVKSIDAASYNSTMSNWVYNIAGTGTTGKMNNLPSLYHNWVDVATLTPTAGMGGNANLTTAEKALATVINPTNTDVLTSVSATGTTYRLRVDQLTNLLADPATDGLAAGQNSQAHKGYAVRVVGANCAGCTVTALDDVTLYTPVATSAAFSIPLVSIPPEYGGHSFSLFVFDPGDVSCTASNQCSNVITVMQPNGITGGVANPQIPATNNNPGPQPATFVGKPGEGGPTDYTQISASSTDSIQTQNWAASPRNIYGGLWVQFKITVPQNYPSLIDPNNSATWFWNLSYSTAQPAGDTISVNLGFTGAPVHLISG
jgi:Flp pilus assembly protein TadG